MSDRTTARQWLQQTLHAARHAELHEDETLATWLDASARHREMVAVAVERRWIIEDEGGAWLACAGDHSRLSPLQVSLGLTSSARYRDAADDLLAHMRGA